jgi:hypothetical protein
MAFIGRAVAPTPISANDVPDLPASKITTGTFADARLSSSSVTQHAQSVDLQPIKSDISALALREATNESSASFNLPNQHIDTFATDTLGTKTTAQVQSGYVSSSADSDQSVTINSSNYTTYVNSDPVIHHANTSSFSGWPNGTYTTISNYNTASAPDFQTGSSLGTKGEKLFGTNGNDQSAWVLWNRTNSGTTNYFATFIGLELTTPMALRDWSVRWQNGSGSFWTMSMYMYNNASGGSAGNSDQSLGGLNIKSGNSISNGTTYTSSSDWTGYSGSNFASNTSKQSYFWINPFHYNGTNSYMFDTLTMTGLMAVPTTSATGTIIQNTNTVGSAKTKVGGTILYKDNQGTATLGTDMKVYFSCNGGTNWTEASSYSAITPVYSTGVKQVRLGETTCTSGTDVRYKVEWANQSAGSKETQLHGIGTNY